MGWTGGPVLGIETSCDETSVGIVEGGRLRALIIASQDAHAAFGGVVPEIAARAHLRVLDRVAAAAIAEAGMKPDEVKGIGVTRGPGLIGSLLIGVNWAKGLAFSLDRPLLGVHHMEAHLFANSLEREDARPPFVALLVSGGHTLLLFAPEWGRYRLLGLTRDDAAGEAFDKVARRLGLGYPGGPALERAARNGEPGRVRLPRPLLSRQQEIGDAGYFDFSFSGLKTAAALLADELEGRGADALARAVPDVAAEFQAAVVEVLVTKTMRAVRATGCGRVLLGGGVACNGALRQAMAEAVDDPASLFVPSPRLASDNGAMIARVAEHRLERGEASDLGLTADASLPFPAMVRWRGVEAASSHARDTAVHH